ncbi:MAG: hypothetical protein OEV59_06640 [Deltaproteobacteria bacterium]|nr:hypothetical protein [Deltaproteobacteria bacterium]
MANAKEVLETAIEMERKVASIYRVFHNKFVGDEKHEQLWRTLAGEEDAHAAFLRNELSMLERVPGAFAGTSVKLDELKAANAVLDGHLAYAEKGGYSGADALCLAAKIEHTLVEAAYTRLIKVTSPVLARIFEDLTKDDHKQKLMEAIKAAGVECK